MGGWTQLYFLKAEYFFLLVAEGATSSTLAAVTAASVFDTYNNLSVGIWSSEMPPEPLIFLVIMKEPHTFG